jgi:hypothetical protein
MEKKIKGCAHIIMKRGKIVNIFTHLNKLPENGIVHLKADKVYSISEFKKSHKNDHKELKKHKPKVIISEF